jgi:hypothetical protein
VADLAGGLVRCVLGGILMPRLSRQLERRADRLATERETREGAYARALRKISEVNLTPLVEPGKGGTHPHVYDRLVAAGAPPDFPRPAPPSLARTRLAGLAAILVLVAAWAGLLFARFSLAPRSVSEQAVLRSLVLGGRTDLDLSDLALLRWNEQHLDEAAIFYQAAGEIDLDHVFYPANQAIVLGALGRCREAFDAASEAQRRHILQPAVGGAEILRVAWEAVAQCPRRQGR